MSNDITLIEAIRRKQAEIISELEQLKNEDAPARAGIQL